jgi:energy-converting hydrogenase Eha subunit G
MEIKGMSSLEGVGWDLWITLFWSYLGMGSYDFTISGS